MNKCREIKLAIALSLSCLLGCMPDRDYEYSLQMEDAILEMREPGEPAVTCADSVVLRIGDHRAKSGTVIWKSTDQAIVAELVRGCRFLPAAEEQRLLNTPATSTTELRDDITLTFICREQKSRALVRLEIGQPDTVGWRITGASKAGIGPSDPALRASFKRLGLLERLQGPARAD